MENKKELVSFLRNFEVTTTIGEVLKKLSDDKEEIEKEMKRLLQDVGKTYYVEEDEYDDYTGEETPAKHWLKITGTDIICDRTPMYVCEWLTVDKRTVSFIDDITMRPDDLYAYEEISPDKYEEAVRLYNTMRNFHP